jgi:hypothetical protein
VFCSAACRCRSCSTAIFHKNSVPAGAFLVSRMALFQIVGATEIPNENFRTARQNFYFRSLKLALDPKTTHLTITRMPECNILADPDIVFKTQLIF